MIFEWDEEKNKINIQKHGISFEHASLVFEDEYYIEDYAYGHDEDEDRYDVIGMVDDVLYVVVTYRENDVVRLISARLATKAERRRYEWQWFG